MDQPCEGDGSCIEKVDEHLEDWDVNDRAEFTYFTFDNNENWFRKFACEHNCMPIKCPNFLICGNADQKYEFGYHNGRCLDCDIGYGKNFIFKEQTEECHICLEEKNIQVYFTGCDVHTCCLNCFKRVKKCSLCRSEPLGLEWQYGIKRTQSGQLYHEDDNGDPEHYYKEIHRGYKSDSVEDPEFYNAYLKFLGRN
jgi:hypothetical protein